MDLTLHQVSYVANVEVGNPANVCELLNALLFLGNFNFGLGDRLIIDTGSANTWVGANMPYIITQTSQCTGNSVANQYGPAFFEGNECTN